MIYEDDGVIMKYIDGGQTLCESVYKIEVYQVKLEVTTNILTTNVVWNPDRIIERRTL